MVLPWTFFRLFEFLVVMVVGVALAGNGFGVGHGSVDIIPKRGGHPIYIVPIFIVMHAVVYPKRLQKVLRRLKCVYHIVNGQV